MGTDNPGERWRRALLNFAYQNIGFNLKQLIEVLHCDLQVAIHEGLVEVQDDMLKATANFANNFHITVTTLSAAQVHALLDHMHARHAGSHSSLAAVWHGTTLMRTESFLQDGPTKLLQSFFDRLPDHQIDIERGSTHPTELEMEVDHFSKVLQTHLVDVTANPTLMLDFSCGIEGILAIDLTKNEVEVCYLPPKGNIADNPEDDIERPTTAPSPLNHHQTVCGESFQNSAPPHMDSDVVQGTSSALALGIIPTTSLASDKQQFSPQSMGRLKDLMSKESRTQTLIMAGTEEASTHFNAHASKDEASCDGDISDADEEDIEVVPDEVDDTQIEGSKPAETISIADKIVLKATNKEDGGQTLKPVDKNPAQQHSNKPSSQTRDDLVCYN